MTGRRDFIVGLIAGKPVPVITKVWADLSSFASEVRYAASHTHDILNAAIGQTGHSTSLAEQIQWSHRLVQHPRPTTGRKTWSMKPSCINSSGKC